MNKSFKIVLIILLVVFAFYAGSNLGFLNKDREKRLAEKIRSQVLQEVRSEWSNEVRNQIKEELLAELKEKDVDSLAQAPLPSLESAAESKESLDHAVRRIVRETFNENNKDLGISNEELDQYVASGEIESNLGVSGYTKSPDLLAKNNAASNNTTQKRRTTQAELGKTVAGERTESVERTLQQRGSMLLPKGKWVIDPSTSWAHFSSNKINLGGVTLFNLLTIGTIGTQEINRDIFIQSLSVKYGLLNNLQTEVKIPYRGEYDRITNTNTSNQPISETTRGDSGIGDIDFGISRQIGWEHGLMPDLIAAFGFKTITGKAYGHTIGFGSGHYSFRSSLVAAKSSDPAVIFGSLSYTYNFERQDIDGVGDVKPGDSFGYSLGTAIALSYQTAINFSFDNSVVFKTKRNGSYLLDSFLNVANFKVGFNWALDESKSVDFNVGLGLTKDSPDVTVDLGFPITF